MGVVAKGLVEVVGVADEDELGDEGCGAADLVGVAHCLTAVENWWVEDVCNLVQGVREGFERGEGS